MRCRWTGRNLSKIAKWGGGGGRRKRKSEETEKRGMRDLVRDSSCMNFHSFFRASYM